MPCKIQPTNVNQPTQSADHPFQIAFLFLSYGRLPVTALALSAHRPFRTTRFVRGLDNMYLCICIGIQDPDKVPWYMSGVSGNSRSRPFPGIPAIPGNTGLPIPVSENWEWFFHSRSCSQKLGMLFFIPVPVPKIWEGNFPFPFPLPGMDYQSRE